MNDRLSDLAMLRAAFVQSQTQIVNNGEYTPVVVIDKGLALGLLDEIERLRAIEAKLRGRHRARQLAVQRRCDECMALWPCPTIRLLDGEL